MQYGLSIPMGISDVAENIWDELDIDYGVMSAGAGSAEYTFDNSQDRDKAVTQLRAGVGTFFEID